MESKESSQTVCTHLPSIKTHEQNGEQREQSNRLYPPTVNQDTWIKWRAKRAVKPFVPTYRQSRHMNKMESKESSQTAALFALHFVHVSLFLVKMLGVGHCLLELPSLFSLSSCSCYLWVVFLCLCLELLVEIWVRFNASKTWLTSHPLHPPPPTCPPNRVFLTVLRQFLCCCSTLFICRL